ncbi:MAG: hypothetical protein BWY63_03310 [Chloroflexi bacterium ADurb.Bin360]|nr:MAG: hypothetical protein BWY63_03310 [Chloroflexi bacterium ADurb.Bin360]
MGFIAEQAFAPSLIVSSDQVRRHMYQGRLHASRSCQNLVDLVPGEPLIRGDMKSLANGMRVAHQAHKAFGKIISMCERPKRGAIAVHNHRLAAQHAVDGGPATLDRYVRSAVGMRRAHDCYGEFLLPVGAHEAFLTGGFIARILPIRVIQHR